MANVMPTEKRNTILRHLCEGNGIRSTARLMHTDIKGVLRQLEWAGEHCRRLMNDRLTGLHLGHVEVDEMWTFVQKKQARLTIDEKALRHDIGDIFFWYGIDQESKLIPAFLLGKRTGDNARRFMLDLRSRLVFPNPHASDAHAFGFGGHRTIVQISTDGLAAYPEAVDLAFGPYAKFGTIVKEYRNANIVYEPSEIVGTKRRAVFSMEESEVGTICTSHVERSNLTVRTFMRRFTRLALGFSKKLERLEDACALHVAYYNFCWRPREPGKRGRLRPTPAQAAGLTNHVWSFHELMGA
jgi:IS1 family transposase